MNPIVLESSKKLLIKHEEKRNFLYSDTRGNFTIGVGYNITARGLPDAWVMSQLEDDINFFYNHLSTMFEWFGKLNNARQSALVDMCFMGWKKFLTFQRMIYFFSINDLDNAAKEILDSEYGKSETHNRATELAEIIKTGIVNI